jgi:hypothetical protein
MLFITADLEASSLLPLYLHKADRILNEGRVSSVYKYMYNNCNVISNAYDLPEQTSAMVIASFTTKLTRDIEQFIKCLHLGL